MATIFRQSNTNGLGELANAMGAFPAMRRQYNMQAQGNRVQRDLTQARLQGQALQNQNIQPMADAQLRGQELKNQGSALTVQSKQNLADARSKMSAQYGPMALTAKSFTDWTGGKGNIQDQGFLNQAANGYTVDPNRARFMANLGGQNIQDQYAIQNNTVIDKMGGLNAPTAVGQSMINNPTVSGASPFMKIQDPLGMGALLVNKKTLEPAAKIGMMGEIEHLSGSPQYQAPALSTIQAPQPTTVDNEPGWMSQLVDAMFGNSQPAPQANIQPASQAVPLNPTVIRNIIEGSNVETSAAALSGMTNEEIAIDSAIFAARTAVNSGAPRKQMEEWLIEKGIDPGRL